MDVIGSIVDHWPWNMESDIGFLVVYGVIVATVFGVAWWQMRAMGLKADEARDNRGPRLHDGSLPAGADLWTVAYMQGGQKGLAAALVTAAVADGWLVMDGNAFAVKPASPTEPALRELYQAIRSYSIVATIRKGAFNVAAALIPDIERDLEAVGHRRSAAETLPMHLVVGAAVAAAVVAGFVRIGTRLWLSNVTAEAPMELVTAMFGSVPAAVLLMQASTRASSWTTHLAWLTDVTSALRDDVISGVRTSPQDVVLAVAVAGPSVSVRVPMLKGFQKLLLTTAVKPNDA